ncbi:MAG TPA: hypothetical protein VGT24_11440 [Candidatus Acidoferrales bacterium]|nr:hypothetical protein [Candidatus Acidoferrales bacterium]
MVGFDTTFLTLMFVPNAKHSIADAKARVEFLISDLSGRGDQILIPTPALSEILVRSGKARNAIIQKLTKNPRFVIAPFDLRSALELSVMTDAALSRSDKKGGSAATWAKVKFDRQIIAIAKVERVSCIYSEDGDIHSIGKHEGLSVLGVADITIPSGTQFRLTPPGE